MKKLLALLLLLALPAQAQPVTPFPTFLTGQNPTSIPLGAGDLVPVIQGGVTTKLARPFTSINGITCYLTDSCTIALGSISLANTHMLVGNASNVATDVALSGVLAITNLGVTSLNANAVTTAAIAAANVTNAKLANPATTVNGVTCTLGSTCTITASAGSVAVASTTISGGASGDILYDNAGVLGELATTGSGNVVLATSPTVSGLTVTGSLTATGLVTNGDLVNASTTVNGQTCTLGSTCTITASAGSITVGTTTIASGTTTQFLYNNAGVLGNQTAVTSATCGTGLSGGTITTTGTCTLDLTHANTWTGLQTMTDGDFALKGSSSGTTVLKAAATAGSTTITFPNATDTVAVLGLADQTVAGGANVTSLSQSTGNITVDCGARPAQYITNGGAFTITAPTSDGYCYLDVENNASAGAVSLSGFAPNAMGGATLDTTNGHNFRLVISRVHAHANIFAIALQ